MIKINIVLDATKLRLKNETAKKFLGFFIGKSRFSVAFRLLFGCISMCGLSHFKNERCTIVFSL